MNQTVYLTDPLQEKRHEVLAGLIWKYPNRVLLLTTLFCSSRCRFCFRKNLYDNKFKRAGDSEIVKFVKNHQEIKEFIFSGGEPLTIVDDIYKLAKKLVLINHLKVFRIHTRLPIMELEKVNSLILKKIVDLTDKPWYLVLHVNTPQELENKTTKEVIYKLRKAGFILLSHTVFLKGVNDSVIILEKLFSTLIELGVKPYYIFHCDNMAHTQKYIVPLKKEIKIMTELRKKLSGLANPTHVIDSESGMGKIPAPSDFWSCNIKSYKDFEDTANNS